MKQVNMNKCPNCGSEEFMTRPNRYDCLKFINGKFIIEKSEFINDEETIFCRECGAEVDEKISFQKRKIVFVNKRLAH